MEILPKSNDILDRIKVFETFENIDDKALQWVIDHSTYKKYDEGEAVFTAGKEVDVMQIIVDGEYVVTRHQNGNSRILGTWGTGSITGVLPFSRMKTAGANGKALRSTFILEFPKQQFTEMVNVSYELVQNLVAVMSNRIRDFTHIQMQNEKWMSLGKLSAGLAHELNNPASAMVRSADELYKQTHKTPERFKQIMTMRVTPEETDEINKILFEKINNWQDLEDLPMLKREERLDDIIDFLEDNDIEDGDDIAETFVDFGMSVEEIEKINEIRPNVPLIITTAHQEVEFLIKAIELGVHSYIMKPIDIYKIIDSLIKSIEPVILKKQLLEKNQELHKLNDSLELKVKEKVPYVILVYSIFIFLLVIS